MSEPQVVRLQQEAAQRVQRMAERSRRLVHEHPVNVYRGATLTPTAPPCEPPQAVPEKPAYPSENPCRKGWLSFLAGDEERALLLLLTVVLSQNGAPPELLLALLYVAF